MFRIPACPFAFPFEAAQNLGYVLRFRDNPGLRMGLLMGGTHQIRMYMRPWSMLTVLVRFVDSIWYA